MRRLPVFLFALLLLASAATALAGSVAAGDGALGVSDANAGIIYVKGNGLIYGTINQGTLTVINYTPAGLSTPQVSGSMQKLPVGTATQYSGSDIRFLFPNGVYALRFSGVGIDISAFGMGAVSAIGAGTANDGTMGTNGGTGLQLGATPTTLVFGGSKTPNYAPTAKGSSH